MSRRDLTADEKIPDHHAQTQLRMLHQTGAPAGRGPSVEDKYAYMYMDTQMTSKNLAVREDVYRALLDAKKGGESFSDVIERLLEGKQDLMSFAGALSSDKDFALVADDILRVRKKTVLRT